MTTDSTLMTIAGREIGPGHPCFVIAEAGVNHNGDVAMAHELIDLAVAAGADAVKFQTFHPDALVSEQAAAAPYQQTSGASQQHSMLEELTLPLSAWQSLSDHASSRKCGHNASEKCGTSVSRTAAHPFNRSLHLGRGPQGTPCP